MNEKRCLFLLDCKSILLGVSELYGVSARLDFRKLKDLAFREADTSYSRCLSFIDLENPGIQKLSKVLSKLGYKVVPYGPHVRNENLISVHMTIEIMNNYNKYDTIIVCSGRGDLAPLYEFIVGKDREVEIIYFSEGRSSQLNKCVTREIELDEQVLMSNLEPPAPSFVPSTSCSTDVATV